MLDRIGSAIVTRGRHQTPGSGEGRAPTVRPIKNLFQEIGGRERVLALMERFYDVMERAEPALAALHELDGDGKVSRRNRDRFGSFLVGWLGGPEDYVRENGHPRLRMRHARVPVGTAMRDAWVRCMAAAMDDCEVPEPTQAFLRARFAEVANFLRNVEDEG